MEKKEEGVSCLALSKTSLVWLAVLLLAGLFTALTVLMVNIEKDNELIIKSLLPLSKKAAENQRFREFKNVQPESDEFRSENFDRPVTASNEYVTKGDDIEEPDVDKSAEKTRDEVKSPDGEAEKLREVVETLTEESEKIRDDVDKPILEARELRDEAEMSRVGAEKIANQFEKPKDEAENSGDDAEISQDVQFVQSAGQPEPQDLANIPESLPGPVTYSYREGEQAILRCSIVGLGDRQDASWKRSSSNGYLSFGLTKFSVNPRYSVDRQGNDWILAIRDVLLADAGVYECQVSSGPKIFRRHFTLEVLGQVHHSTAAPAQPADQDSHPAAVLDCAQGFTRIAGVCYGVFKRRLTWNEAKRSCTRMAKGGFLAEPKSLEENKNIVDLVKSNSIKYAWIGLTDQAREGHWVWAHSVTNVTFTHWGYGNPDNSEYWGYGGEDCVHVSADKYNTYRWYDTPCEHEHYFVCQM